LLGAIRKHEAKPNLDRAGQHADRQASAERVTNGSRHRQDPRRAFCQARSQREVELARKVAGWPAWRDGRRRSHSSRLKLGEHATRGITDGDHEGEGKQWMFLDEILDLRRGIDFSRATPIVATVVRR
jgi:hypothetical protein